MSRTYRLFPYTTLYRSYGFSPDFCHAGDPASKGIVENLVGYAKRDVPTPDADADLVAWNEVAVEWCAERNGLEHFEICAIPDDRSEQHTSELQYLMLHSYAVFCMKQKNHDSPKYT